MQKEECIISGQFEKDCKPNHVGINEVGAVLCGRNYSPGITNRFSY